MAFTGDIIPHGPVVTSGRNFGREQGLAHDFDPMWARLAPWLDRADLAICHLETTLSTDETGATGYPRFRGPRSFGEALARAGYDGCSTASNHSLDYGAQGVVDTYDVLEAAGLGVAGTGRQPEETAGATFYRVDGPAGEVVVAHLSATYGFNGFPLPEGRPWMANVIDIPNLLAQAADARDRGADVVVVSLHCCIEYVHAPTDRQLAMARELLASPDVDLVVGHHAHVVQPIERIGDKYAVYGVGNILTNQHATSCCPAASQDGVLVEVTFTERADGRFVATDVVYVPTWVDRANGHVVIPVLEALADPDLDGATRPVLEQSLRRTVTAIDMLWAHGQGVRPALGGPADP